MLNIDADDVVDDNVGLPRVLRRLTAPPTHRATIERQMAAMAVSSTQTTTYRIISYPATLFVMAVPE